MLNSPTFTSALVALCVITASAAGCDQGLQRDQEILERTGSKTCYKGYYTSTVSGGMTIKTTPNPEDPDGGDGPFPWPLQEWELETLTQYASDTMVTRFEGSEAARSCETVCEERGLGWRGEGCAIDSYVDISDPIAEESRDGTRSRTLEIEAEVIPGCACS